MLKIIAIGKKHEAWVEEGIKRYQQRLRKPLTVEWSLLPHSQQSEVRAREEESSRLLARLRPDDFVVLLDERGENLSSPALAELIDANIARPIVMVIGGAYGVSDAMSQRADFILSLSKLVFPHQLVRLLLIEQLYRAQEITRGGSYHHE